MGTALIMLSVTPRWGAPGPESGRSPVDGREAQVAAA